MSRARTTLPIVALAVLAALLVGCAEEPASQPDAGDASASPPAQEDGSAGGASCFEEPTTTESGLVIEDLECGDGDVAEAGQTVTVHYVGTLENGEQFDSSRDAGRPLPFQLGAGGVIPGWDEGVAGMRVGGLRRLTIPPELAYGEQGYPPVIPPNATLEFEIELLEVGPPLT